AGGCDRRSAARAGARGSGSANARQGQDNPQGGNRQGADRERGGGVTKKRRAVTCVRVGVLRGCALVVGCMWLSGCGYALAGRGSFLPSYIRVIGIPTFANRTTIFN